MVELSSRNMAELIETHLESVGVLGIVSHDGLVVVVEHHLPVLFDITIKRDPLL